MLLKGIYIWGYEWTISLDSLSDLEMKMCSGGRGYFVVRVK